jgi:DUF1680 family protein
MQGSRKLSLTQQTSYPHQPTTQITVSSSSPSAFPIYVRIPAWAGPKTSIAINGERANSSPAPGQFARLDRTWRTGDRIEIEFDMPTVLEPVDPQHPNLVAVVHGPLALFAVGKVPEKIGKQELLSAAQSSQGSTDWQVRAGEESLALKPFSAIQDEHYRLYLNVDTQV